MTNYSLFGQRFTRPSGINELMQDLGEAIKSQDPATCMLGGGNPAVIPALNDVFEQEIQQALADGSLHKGLGFYSTPQGDRGFIEALVDFFNRHYQWNISHKNIVLTNGSQNSFFYLFNLLAGKMADGRCRKILFPLAPEYIGYRDIGLSDDMFASGQPLIETLPAQQFKYRIDFDALEITPDIGAICVSRPTNPTGNVVTDDELATLDLLAKQHGIPLIIDNAYGFPFPGALYTQATLPWHENIILGMSLSKLGLPGLRTGIVVANEAIVDILSTMNGNLCLSPNNMGAAIMTRLLQSDEIIPLRDTVVRPFYQHKMQRALQLAQTIFAGLPVAIHKLEGAFFLWLWLQELPISTKALYLRLKAKKVFVIPGEDFFMGIDANWPHQYQCVRINYASSDEQLERGLRILAQEVRMLTTAGAH